MKTPYLQIALLGLVVILAMSGCATSFEKEPAPVAKSAPVPPPPPPKPEAKPEVKPKPEAKPKKPEMDNVELKLSVQNFDFDKATMRDDQRKEIDDWMATEWKGVTIGAVIV